MPPLTLPMAELANMKLISFKLKVPWDWKQPMGNPDRDHFSKAFSLSEHVSGASVMSPPEVVSPATTNKYHGDAAKEVSKWYKDFMKDATSNIKSAMDSWRPKVKFKSIQVLTLSALGSSVLDAPDIKNEPAFSSWKPKEKNGKAYAKAVIEGFSKNFMEYAKACTTPGLPLWPAFCAFPSAMAPPMPAIPMPIIAYISPQMAKVAVSMQLKSAMVDALDQGVKDNDPSGDHAKVLDSIATAVSTAILAWMPMQQVMALMGKGPGPAYAPPVSPVSPIMGGDVLPTPGHLP